MIYIKDWTNIDNWEINEDKIQIFLQNGYIDLETACKLIEEYNKLKII